MVFGATTWQLDLAAISSPPSQVWLPRTVWNKSGRLAAYSRAGKTAGDGSLCVEWCDALREKAADQFKIQITDLTSTWYEAHPSQRICSVMLLLVLQEPELKLDQTSWQRFPPDLSQLFLRNSLSCQSAPSTYVIACISERTCVFSSGQSRSVCEPRATAPLTTYLQRGDGLALLCCIKADEVGAAWECFYQTSHFLSNLIRLTFQYETKVINNWWLCNCTLLAEKPETPHTSDFNCNQKMRSTKYEMHHILLTPHILITRCTHDQHGTVWWISAIHCVVNCFHRKQLRKVGVPTFWQSRHS